MDDILKATLLYDFYGELLTEKQKMIFEYYYLNDMSLSEIGESLEIIRQAVRDLLKRTEHILLEYENKLCLVDKFMAQKQSVRLIKKLASELKDTCRLDELSVKKVEKIMEIADDILD